MSGQAVLRVMAAGEIILFYLHLIIILKHVGVIPTQQEA